jgi:hypothetical protein
VAGVGVGAMEGDAKGVSEGDAVGISDGPLDGPSERDGTPNDPNGAVLGVPATQPATSAATNPIESQARCWFICIFDAGRV